jgi:membrane protein implicated in regulation of membrane protease activity
MNFISWLVFGVLFMVAEMTSGSFYLLAIGLAFVYPAIGDLVGSSTDTQLAVLGAGVVGHVLVVTIWRRRKPARAPIDSAAEIGDSVEVIEWLDECSAMVRYRDQVWTADKVRAEMPNASRGIIQSVQGSRLIISTEAITAN